MKSNHFKMRWLCLLFALFTLNIQAQITVDIKNKPLKEAIKTIERSSNYSFFYNVELEGLDKLVTVKTDNASLEETMKQLLKGTNITFQRKVDNVVVLLSKQQQAAKRSRSVSGKVVDEKGEAIIGASIIVKGSSIGTSTDVDGNFTINNISDNALLVVSSIGYKKTEVPVTNENPIEIRLNEDSNLMDEVVVVGYGVQKKINLTGSVVSVDHDVLANRPIANVTTGLQGMLPGVSIVNTTSRPGDNNSSIRVRGIGTLNNSDPLILIDGVEGDMNTLNPDDIESVSVLKDAASASIYGAQAANGVIIITTKRAKKGETRVDFDMSLTLQTYQCGFDMLNADEWGQVYWSAYKYANNGATPSSEIYGNGATPQLQDYIGLNGAKVHAVDTDWRDVVYRTALMQNYSATLSKGSDNGAFSLALNYLDHDGLVENTNFQRINTRISSNYHYLDNRLRIGENVAINRWTQTLSPAGVDENAIKQHPAKTVYDENGNYNDAINDVLGDAPNMARLLENEKQNKHDYWRIFGNAFLEIEPIKNLVLKTNFGMNYYDETNKTFEPAWARDEVNKLTQSSNKRLDWVWTNTVTYSKAFGKNNLTALLGTEAKKNHSESMFGYGTGLAVEDEDYIYLDGVTAGKNVGAGASNYGMVSYFGKVNYDYEGRYLASVTVRRDASSRLAKGNNVDYFPSVSAGWRISSEKFMEATKNWLADLKLRASWGINGNDIIDNESPYTKYLISLKDASYNMNGDGTTLAPGGYKVRSTNPDLKWESTRQLNIGVDAAFLNGRLSASLDYFDKKTSDMLVEKPYIAVIGEGGYCWYNGGTMNNKGFEMALTWNDKVKDFQYNVAFNLSYYKNEVTELSEEIYYTYGGGNGVDKTLVGQPFGSWMGFKTDGVFRTQQEVDADGNGTIDTNDRVWLGSDNPKVIAGLNLGASWKGFDLSMFFNGMIRDAYNNSKYYTDLFQCWTGNHSTRLLDAMHAYENFEKTGVYNSSVPALTTLNSNNEHEVSEFYIENGSYIKLKSLTLGYTLPKAALDKMKMRHARIYFQAQNLFTITGYMGADPEGLGYPYPLPRTFSLGLSFGF